MMVVVHAEPGRLRDTPGTAPAGVCRICCAPYWMTVQNMDLRSDQLCDLCVTWLWRNPDKDPATAIHSRGFQVSQERVIAGGGDWRARAACRDADCRLFEPPPRRSGTPMLVPAAREAAREIALIYCADCPVLAECRAEAAAHEYEGLWGGVMRVLYALPADGAYVADLLDPVQDNGSRG